MKREDVKREDVKREDVKREDVKRGLNAARDARYAAVIAGCGPQIALAAVGMVETRAGLEQARKLEHEGQARSAVLGAINARLKEVT